MTSDEQTASDKKASGGLLRSSLVVGIMTMLSRVMGLVRDIIIAVYFGSQAEADAFFVAFKIPNFLRRLFAEGAFSQAFVPVLSEYRTKQPKEAVQELINKVAGTLGLTLALVTALSMVAAPLLILLFAPGFRGETAKLALAGDMLRITFPYLLLISLTAFSGSILNSYNKFAVPAFTPVLLNISLIGSTILLTPYFEQPAMALAWGVVIAGVSQLLLQIPFLRQIQLLPKPVWGWRDEGVQRILKLMAPAMFGVSVAQINLLLDTVLASFLQTGSISWLYYSDRLMELPLGMFGIAIATVILPSLSRQHAGDDPKAFSATLDWAVRLVLLIGVPAAVALFLLAEPLIATLFFHGRMEDRDVLMAAMSLRAYASGLLFFMLIKVLAPGFFARQDTRTPVKIAMKAMVANMIFNLALIWPLQHAGLALATTLSAAMNAGMLLFGLVRIGVFQFQPGWKLYGSRLLLANIVMGGLLVYLCAAPQIWLDWILMQRIQSLAILVAAGSGAYILTLGVAGLRPRHFKH